MAFINIGPSTVRYPEVEGRLQSMYTRNPNSFGVARAVQSIPVAYTTGAYRRVDATEAARIDRPLVWSPGQPRPKNTRTKVEWDTFRLVRYGDGEAFDIRTEQNSQGQQGSISAVMTSASIIAQRIMTQLSTEFEQEIIAASAAGSGFDSPSAPNGGAWGSASATNRYIQATFQHAAATISEQTYGALRPSDLVCCISSQTARSMASSAEILDLVKQAPGSLDLLSATGNYAMYGLPTYLYGIELVVFDDYVISTNEGDATPTVRRILDGLGTVSTVPFNSIAFFNPKPRQLAGGPDRAINEGGPDAPLNFEAPHGIAKLVREDLTVLGNTDTFNQIQEVGVHTECKFETVNRLSCVVARDLFDAN